MTSPSTQLNQLTHLRRTEIGRFVPPQVFTEVQQFYARQMNLLDGAAPDNAAWAATFTEDAVFESNVAERLVGRPAILRSVTAATDRIFADDLDFRHWIGMLDIEPLDDAEEDGDGAGEDGDGGGGLRTRYYALAMSTPRNGSLTIRSHTVGFDHLVRRDGRWLVRHRYLSVDGRPS